MSKRLMTKKEAAAYCGVSPSTFANWVARGVVPPKIHGTKRFDQKALDQVLDRHSGLTSTNREPDPFQEWLDRHHAR
jgi:hypothetical protein